MVEDDNGVKREYAAFLRFLDPNGHIDAIHVDDRLVHLGKAHGQSRVVEDRGEGRLQPKHGGWITDAQRQALRDLARCRTAALGGHVGKCLDCGHERIAYNSCRNRHCPKCQGAARARWLDGETEYLLPVAYYHLVFTLPAEVAKLALANPAALYDLLLQAAAATLRGVAADPKWLGAATGMVLVLHTWGQNLHHHPHVHGVVTGGGLSGRWAPTSTSACHPRSSIASQS